MHFFTSLVMIAALMTHEFMGSLGICLCAACNEQNCKSPPSRVVEESPRCCCCHRQRPAAIDEAKPQSCNCGKQPEPSMQPVAQAFRLPSESLFIPPVPASVQDSDRPLRAVSPNDSIGHPSCSLQELYCVWRE